MDSPREISKEELESFKSLYHTDYSVGDLTPTLCALHGVEPPEVCGGDPIAQIIDQAAHLMGGEGKNQRTLIFAPDAVGEIHRQHYPEELARVERLAGFRIPSSSVMPSVTPVCFATIFSGASPKVHGIQKYEKPVLKIPTLFDVFAASGKRVAVVSANTCSIDMIFRGRDIEYFSTRNGTGSFELTRLLLREDRYDLVVCYFGDYDHMSHVTGPDSPESVAELRRAVSYFERLVEDTEREWAKYNRAVVWSPDHGNHPVDETHGAHGSNIPEDMVVNHFYRLRGGTRG